MSKAIVILPDNEILGKTLAEKLSIPILATLIRRFPDGETFVQLKSEVKDKHILVVCTLDRPDNKLLPLYFLCKTLKEFGTSKITLVAPYLAYMRQDKRFHEGEAITSIQFAKLISSFVDELITIDPHLHRISKLEEIYSIPTKVLHAAPLVSAWIAERIPNAVIVGPDEESEQWVSDVAKTAHVQYMVLRKIRNNDTDVQVSVPDVKQWENHVPVLVDDIISTARTMIETVKYLTKAGYKNPICIGIHGVFAADAFEQLTATGAQVVTCNTIIHCSNSIDVSNLFIQTIK